MENSVGCNLQTSYETIEKQSLHRQQLAFRQHHVARVTEPKTVYYPSMLLSIDNQSYDCIVL